MFTKEDGDEGEEEEEEVVRSVIGDTKSISQAKTQ